MSDQAHPRLFDPYRLGGVELRNRSVLAPMTRVSAEADGTVSERVREYYRIFAAGGFGMLITEALYIDTERSVAYLHQPGLAGDAHTASWRAVVDAVHGEGAKFVAQLAHAGPQAQCAPYGLGPLGPSGRRARGEQLAMYRGSGPYPVPSPATAKDIAAVRRAFVDAALRAREAGFDGVEIHSANGYLLDAFLTDYLNVRDDRYGGSPRNRVRLTAEVVGDVRAAVGDDFVVGVRISQGKVSDLTHKWTGGVEEAEEVFTGLAGTGADYVHTTEHVASAPAFEDDPRSLACLAGQFTGATVIANGHIDDGDEAAGLLARGHADLVAVGKSALANRNWPERVRAGVPLEKPCVPTEGGLADVEAWELEADALLRLPEPAL